MGRARVTPAPARKPRGTVFFTRPEGERKNSGIPRYGYLVQHKFIQTDGIIWKASSLPWKSSAAAAKLLSNQSITKITEQTARFSPTAAAPSSRRTVAHRLNAMKRLGIIQRYDSTISPYSPVGTSWYFPPFSVVLQQWADNPEIATIGKPAFSSAARVNSL